MYVAPRVNKPPRADISPKEQTITLPTNEVVLDGSSEYNKIYKIKIDVPVYKYNYSYRDAYSTTLTCWCILAQFLLRLIMCSSQPFSRHSSDLLQCGWCSKIYMNSCTM